MQGNYYYKILIAFNSFLVVHCAILKFNVHHHFFSRQTFMTEALTRLRFKNWRHWLLLLCSCQGTEYVGRKSLYKKVLGGIFKIKEVICHLVIILLHLMCIYNCSYCLSGKLCVIFPHNQDLSLHWMQETNAEFTQSPTFPWTLAFNIATT